MKLREIRIRKFRNLKDFVIKFDEVPITVLLGKNGAAKSNLIEFIAHIFAELEMEVDRPKYAYLLRYECRTKEIAIDARYTDAEKVSITIDGEAITYSRFVKKPRNQEESRGYEDYLPTNIFIYYSGLSGRLSSVCDEVKSRYERELRAASNPRLRRLFFTDGRHSSLILFAYLADQRVQAKSFLKDRLGIEGLESATLKLSRSMVGSRVNKLVTSGPEPDFWNAGGEVLNTLRWLNENSIPLRHKEEVELSKRTRKVVSEKRIDLKAIYFHFNQVFPLHELIPDLEAPEKGKRRFTGKTSRPFEKPQFLNSKDLFKRLDDLHLTGYRVEINFNLKLGGVPEAVSLTHLSEGEQQLLTVIGLLRFTKDNDTLFLLDEPDTHLNPQWSYEYKGILEETMGFKDGGADETNSQILMASHDPVMIADMNKESIRLMERKTRKNEKAISDEAEVFIEASTPSENPHDLGIARILRELQGIPDLLGPEKLAKLEEKRKLAFSDETLSPEQEQRLLELAIETQDIDLTTYIEDPLYTHFVNEVMNHEDYASLRRHFSSDSMFHRLKAVSEKARDSLLAKATSRITK
jgi:predicted ATPase